VSETVTVESLRDYFRKFSHCCMGYFRCCATSPRRIRWRVYEIISASLVITAFLDVPPCHTSEIVTVESLRDYFRKFSHCCMGNFLCWATSPRLVRWRVCEIISASFCTAVLSIFLESPGPLLWIVCEIISARLVITAYLNITLSM